MLISVLVVFACAVFAQADEVEVAVSENKTQCIEQLIGWCKNMVYPQQGAGLALLSVTYQEQGSFFRVFCSSDSDGTNCTRNKSPWFTCTPDHVFTYKGQAVSNTTATKDVDEDICNAAEKAFNELFVQNLSYDNTTLKDEVQKGMETFFEQMALMEEQIEMIQKFLKGIPYFWNDSDYGFVSGGSGLTTTAVPSVYNQNKTEPANDIEKE